VNVLVNGRAVDAVAVADRGLHYGDGLFETLAVEEGEPLLWPEHLERLRRGCERLGLVAPDAVQLRSEAERLCRGQGRAVLKLIVTRGPSGRGYAPNPGTPPTRIASLAPWPEYPATYNRDGVAVRWCDTRLARQPQLAGLKHLNRLEQVLARAEWTHGPAEGLMRDTEGYVIEGTMSNVFLVARGALFTPALSFSGVAGIVRQQVMVWAQQAGVECREAWLRPEQIEAADELFLTNSLIGAWPIRRLGPREYAVGPITQAIQAALEASGGIARAR
jgi:4-amino-4-deoxychorismate lyase